MLQPPPPALEIIPLDPTPGPLVEQSDLRVPGHGAPAGRHLALLQQGGRQPLDLPLLGVGVEGVFGDGAGGDGGGGSGLDCGRVGGVVVVPCDNATRSVGAALVDDVDAADVGAVAEVAVRGDGEAALGGAGGEVEVSCGRGGRGE